MWFVPKVKVVLWAGAFLATAVGGSVAIKQKVTAPHEEFGYVGWYCGNRQQTHPVIDSDKLDGGYSSAFVANFDAFERRSCRLSGQLIRDIRFDHRYGAVEVDRGHPEDKDGKPERQTVYFPAPDPANTYYN